MNNILPPFGKIVASNEIAAWWLCDYPVSIREPGITDAVAEHLLWEKRVTVDFAHLDESMSASDFCLCFMGWILAINKDNGLYIEAAANRISKIALSNLLALINTGQNWRYFKVNLRLFPDNQIKKVDYNPDAGVETGEFAPQVKDFFDKATLLEFLLTNIAPNLMPAKISADARKRLKHYLQMSV